MFNGDKLYKPEILDNQGDKIEQDKEKALERDQNEGIKEKEAEIYVEKNLKDFENVEIKKLSELPCWSKINNFLSDKGITDSDVIIVDDEKNWESIYGSNNSKSSHNPNVIILKKEIFNNENISNENISWLIHEIGHIEFYKNLGDKLEEYMEEYHARGEYTNSIMEKNAFQFQFEFLKKSGQTKDECLGFIRKYLDDSLGSDESREKEFEQIRKYADGVY